jgi:tetratricopeptide (TPR) repeat protein
VVGQGIDVVTSPEVDFFVSYAGPDRPWAEWVAKNLEQAGCTVELDVWDWAPGDNAVLRMNDAVTKADRVVALYSAAYFERSRFTTDEWTAVMARRPGPDGRRRLVPLRVAEVDPPGILASLVYRDLFGLAENDARAALLSAVGVTGPRTGVAPRFPGSAGARVPGSLPAVWNVPARNPAFTGRGALLAGLRERLTSGDRALVQAMHGLGGVGKTSLAVEYAYLFAGQYDLGWWINADQAALIAEQVAALGVAAGWVGADTPVTAAAQAVMGRLRTLPMWLLVFDNVEDPAAVHAWVPNGPGHVVITSRRSGFTGIAVPVGVDVFTRDESVAFLREQVPGLDEGDSGRLARALGDLPMALAQAAGLLAETRMTVAEYLDELGQHAGELLDDRVPAGYPASLAASVRLSVDRLGQEDPAAVRLLQLCAVLAPEPIPLAWWEHAPDGVLPAPLAGAVRRPLAFRRALGRLAGYGLARVDTETLQVHRLTQAVLRDQLDPGDLAADRGVAQRVIAAAEPDNDGSDPGSWPAWAVLLPHLLALDPPTAGPELRNTACNALWYLLTRADYATAIPLAGAWYRRWRDTLGPDADHTLRAANELAAGFNATGRYQDARRRFEDTLARCRRVLGEDHPDTLASANNLAVVLGNLGEYAQARDVDEDILARRRRVLGEDHSDTLASAGNLAVDLHNLGEHAQARDLDEDILARRRRVLGEDHPDTLASANNLAVDLHNLGEYAQARDLDEDTLARRGRVLGKDHPDTLSSAGNLASDLRALGEDERARELDDEVARRRQAREQPAEDDTV